jgi:uncharacterized membrane protein
MSLLTPMPKIDHKRVLAAIEAAEVLTSGEIRVLLARHAVSDPIAAAQAYFDSIGMADSPHRNGILIFVAPASRKFAIIGDRAVHEKCGDIFWTSVAGTMGDYFKAGKFTDGVVHGIERAGTLLAKTFPRSGDDGAPKAPQAQEVD